MLQIILNKKYGKGSITYILSPKYFLVGILVGFITCCFLGYIGSEKFLFQDFKRFFWPIEPQTLYYPTASELLMTARHEVSKDKILVLLGGSSIFRGAGQDPNELWSDELQRILGDRYKVLNYATDGASFSSFGGVVYRMLRKEYSKIIFVIATFPFNSQGQIDGLDPYSYLFWDAYYKKLFIPENKEGVVIKQVRKEQMKTYAGMEQHIVSFLDSFFYFRDLWNWVGYHLLFTVWSDFEFQKPFLSRQHFEDEPISPEYRKVLAAANNDDEHLQNALKFLHDMVGNVIQDVLDKNPHVKEAVKMGGTQGYDTVFPSEDRSKILCVQTAYNSRFLSATNHNIQAGYRAFFKQSHTMLQSLGYNALDVGFGFPEEDYIDLSHFSGSGGKKMAVMVAKKIKSMSVLNGYIKHE